MNIDYFYDELEDFQKKLKDIIELSKTVLQTLENDPNADVRALNQKLHNKVEALQLRHTSFEKELWSLIKAVPQAPPIYPILEAAKHSDQHS